MKRLIVCADGTWNSPAQAVPTNVVKIAEAIAISDAQGRRQVVYYHEGVGAEVGLWKRFTGGAFGAGLSRNIQESYRFLASNFEDGDEIWLFGFSRGAYTVRSLAGFIRNCGLLKRQHFERYDEAYALYRDRTDRTHPNSEAAGRFRKHYSSETHIRFIGVWDTVGALGIPVTPLRFWSQRRHEFHDVELSGQVDVAMQALAIDEKRKPFGACLWTRSGPMKNADQILEQHWFPGVHCNVGGGYADSGLSDSALRWMAEGASKFGLSFVGPVGPSASPQGQIENSRTGIYRFLGKKIRPIGSMNPNGNEEEARTTTERRHMLDYAPPNLISFLRRQ